MEGVYRNNLKNRFLATSAFHQNFDFHSSLAFRQCSLAPNQNSDELPCQNSDSSSCFGIQPPPSLTSPKKVLLLTVPKSGTHLVRRAVRLILGVSEAEVNSIDSVVMDDPVTRESMAQELLLYLHEIKCRAGPADQMAVAAFSQQLKDNMGKGGKPQLIREDPGLLLKKAKGLILFDHLWPEYEIVYKDSADKYIKIVMIRDPRDALISQIEWVREGKPWWMPIALLREWRALPFDEHLASLIKLSEEYGGIRSFCCTAVEWQKYKDVLFCRFEDLVGPAGGGDRQRQELALMALAEHLEHPLSKEEIGFIADRLFGGTYTFRVGKVGRWKECMNMEQKALCKSLFGDLLIAMGYENSDDW